VSAAPERLDFATIDGNGSGGVTTWDCSISSDRQSCRKTRTSPAGGYSPLCTLEDKVDTLQALNYAVAPALVALSLLVRWSFAPAFGSNVTYLQFFPAIILASWFGGLGPGVFATFTAGLAAVYYILPPDGFALPSPTDAGSLAIFTGIGLVIATLNGRLRQAHESTRRQADLATTRAERLSTIIDTTVDGIIVIDGRGRIEAFNAGAQRLFGYTEDDVIGKNVNLLMPSPFHEEHDRYLEHYQRTGEAAIIGKGRQVRGRRKDGTEFPLHLSVGEMTIAGERRFTGMLHDLTARVELEDRLRSSEARWRAVIDSAIDGIVVIDASGAIEAFNPAAERLFQYAEAEVTGKNIRMLMPSPYHEQHDGYLSNYLKTAEAKIIGKGREVTGRRKDGSTFPLHLSVGETVLDGQRRFTGILHDLTARIELEEQLREQSALAKLGEMAAVIAHEVKNPLAGIRGVVQVIGGRLPHDSGDAMMMKEVVGRIDSLDGMMKDLLLFARPPKPKRMPLDVMPLLEATANLLKAGAEAAGLAIEVRGGPARVSGDADMLRMVFQNLLINGAHAMEGRGTIRIGVESTGSTCRILITDQGPGIPADIRDRIFTPFFTTKSRGTGLGLPTAKRFIEAHDGKISIVCPPSGGTTVTVQLPSN